jgi:SAM-dependent methyltransferase
MKDKFDVYKKYESKAIMIGWDFSFLSDKVMEEPMPWDYKDIIRTYLRKEDKLLDMETGGGEFLLSLSHPYENTFATEGYPPNYALCKERLSPLGIYVRNSLGENPLPFEDNSFEMIINRHGSYIPSEIKRVLKKDGIFITQQVGSYNNKPLSDKLTPWRESDFDSFTLSKEIEKFRECGFTLLQSDERKLYSRYKTIEGVIFMAKIIEWEFPEFSVKRCYKELCEIDQLIEKNGYFESLEHRFYLVAKNNK